MAEPPPPSVKMRTDENMHDRRKWLLEYKDRRNVVGASERAKKFGRKQGVQMGSLSPWSNRECRRACANDWVFGPDPVLDNVYQCMPQVIQLVLSMLHVLPLKVSFTLLMSFYSNVFITLMSICKHLLHFYVIIIYVTLTCNILFATYTNIKFYLLSLFVFCCLPNVVFHDACDTFYKINVFLISFRSTFSFRR